MSTLQKIPSEPKKHVDENKHNLYKFSKDDVKFTLVPLKRK